MTAIANICSLEDLEHLTGYSRARLTQLAREGILSKASHGKYYTHKCMRAMLEHVRTDSRTRTTGALDPVQEVAKLNVLKQIALADRIKQDRREWLKAGDVEERFSDFVRITVNTLETLPDRLERDTGLNPMQVELAQASIDNLRDALSMKLKEISNDS